MNFANIEPESCMSIQEHYAADCPDECVEQEKSVIYPPGRFSMLDFILQFNQSPAILRNPREMRSEDELHFIGFYLMAKTVAERTTAAFNTADKYGDYVPPFYKGRLDLLTKWVEQAKNLLPDWLKSS